MRAGYVQPPGSTKRPDFEQRMVEEKSTEEQVAAARREGVIEGLERAFALATAQPNPLRAIGAELERLRGGGE